MVWDFRCRHGILDQDDGKVGWTVTLDHTDEIRVRYIAVYGVLVRSGESSRLGSQPSQYYIISRTSACTAYCSTNVSRNDSARGTFDVCDNTRIFRLADAQQFYIVRYYVELQDARLHVHARTAVWSGIR